MKTYKSLYRDPSTVLGIDIGTTLVKAVALHPTYGILAQAEWPYQELFPAPGWVEMDLEQCWEAVRAVIRTLLEVVPAENVAALGVSGPVPALVLLDEQKRPLRLCIQQNDTRALVEVEEMRARLDLRTFFAITGGTVNTWSVAPRWRWLAQHEPEVVARTAYLCGSYDFMTFCLTGELSLEENWAAESGLYDVQQHHWHGEYLTSFALSSALLPAVHSAREVVGEVRREVAVQTGLLEGTPVVAGSANHVAAALAAGLTRSGDILLRFGEAGDVLSCADYAEPDPHFSFHYHTIPGLTLVNGYMASSGRLVRWFRNELASETTLADLDQAAAFVPPGSGGIVALPYFLGEQTPVVDASARGVFAGVMLHHTRAHLYRAVLEAVCYGFQHHLTLLEAAGRPVRRLRATAGDSRGRLWMQMAANVANRPLEMVGSEATSALGVAFVAAQGVGIFQYWEEIERFIAHGVVYLPGEPAVTRYQHGFALYRDLYTRLQAWLPELDSLDGSI